jgi:hypothetical protein
MAREKLAHQRMRGKPKRRRTDVAPVSICKKFGCQAANFVVEARLEEEAAKEI